MKFRLLTASAVFIIVGFSVLSGTMLLEMRHETWTHDVQSSRNLLTAEADDIARTIAVYDLALRSTSSALADPDLIAANSHLQQMALFDHSITAAYQGAVRVIDPSGHAIHDASTLAPAAISPAEREALLRHRDNDAMELFIGRPIGLGAAGGGDITLSRRLETADGRFSGIVSGTIQIAYFSDLFRRLKLGPHDIVSLFRDDGTMLAHFPNNSHVGKSVVGSDIMRQFELNRSGTFTGRSVFDGTRRVYTFTHLGGWPLILDVGLSENDVYAPWRQRAWLVTFCLLTMGIISLCLLLTLRGELNRRVMAEKSARKSETRYRLLADNSSDMIIRFDRQLRRTYVSPSCRAHGYEPADLLGKTLQDWIHPDDWPELLSTIQLAQRESRNSETNYRILHRDGRYIWMEGRYSYMASDGGFIAVLRDITGRKEAELQLEQAVAELSRLAAVDGLTGVANRRSFDTRLAEEWKRAYRSESEIAILVIDVDMFKTYNDQYGHQAGDAVLKAVALAIQNSVRRPGDFVARYGGEEFVVIIPNTDIYGAIEVAETARLAVLDLRIPHDSNPEHVVSISVGASSALPRVTLGIAEHMFTAADEALYSAKSAGRNRVKASITTSSIAST
ncbi:MAG: diguanylate cyclase [Janthinobacterium lividum]